MRKVKIFIQIVILLLSVCLINTNNDFNEVNAITLDNISNIYAAPITSPNGKTIEAVINYYGRTNTVDFTEGSHDWIENDDWDWDTMALDYYHTNEENPKLAIIGPGAKNHASFEVWVPAVSLDGVSGIMFYLDYSNVIDGTNATTYLRFRTPKTNITGNISELDDQYLNANADCYYYDYEKGEWVLSKTLENSFIPLPDYYRGYVYVPFTAYTGITNSMFLQMYHIDMSVGENIDSVSPIYLDDIQVVKEVESHTHEYAYQGSIDATCAHNGIDVLSCECGQVKWDNITIKTAHNHGEKHYCSNGLASALCNDCNNLVYFKENVDLRWEEAVSITYNYNYEGYEPKIYEYPKGYVLTQNDVPWVNNIVEGYAESQFFRYTTDEIGLYGKDPIGLVVSENLELYAQYNNYSFSEQKLRAMASVVSFNGGRYDEVSASNSVIFVGQSNFSLWHGMESWYANRGVPVRNNSIAGATSHVYVEYVEELVLMYKPKVVVCIVSSNDLAYHQMSEKTVMNNMKEFYNKVNENIPDSHVIFVSGNPLPGRNEYFQVIERINNKLETFCNSKSNAYFVDIYDINMGYVLQYPVGWDTWTHLHQPELEHVMGDMIYATLKNVLNDNNIIFNK